MEKGARPVFNVRYHDYLNSTKIWSADWDSHCVRRWAISWSPPDNTNWHPIQEFNECAYKAVLKKFALEKWRGEFPRDKIMRMSPGQLIAERRKKEQEHRLPTLDVYTDNIPQGATGMSQARFRAEEYP